MAKKDLLSKAVVSALLGMTVLSISAAERVQAWVTTGDRSKLLAKEPDVRLEPGKLAPTVLEIDPSTRFQEIQGFGASITDASAWLIQRMNPAQKESLMRELFGRDPSRGMSVTPLTIGASDF